MIITNGKMFILDKMDKRPFWTERVLSHFTASIILKKVTDFIGRRFSHGHGHRFGHEFGRGLGPGNIFNYGKMFPLTLEIDIL